MKTSAKIVAAGQPTQSAVQLEAAIRAKFAKSKINADKFTVHVQGGVATIDGRTDVVQHKETATRMAKTAGAVAVKNQVQRRGEGEGRGTVPESPIPSLGDTATWPTNRAITEHILIEE